MATHKESAKIYEFPAGGHPRRGCHRQGASAHPTATKVAKSEYGSGWYHEAAVAEAEHASEMAGSVHLFTDRF